jgi:hypothetical protein
MTHDQVKPMDPAENNRCSPESDVVRVLEWWEHGDNGRFAGAEELRNITSAALSTTLFRTADPACCF